METEKVRINVRPDDNQDKGLDDVHRVALQGVITSYSIHYTKLYEAGEEFQEVTQLLAFDPEKMQTLALRVLENPGPLFENTLVFLTDPSLRHIPYGKRGIGGRRTIRSRFLQKLVPFLKQFPECSRLPFPDDIAECPGSFLSKSYNFV